MADPVTEYERQRSLRNAQDVARDVRGIAKDAAAFRRSSEGSQQGTDALRVLAGRSAEDLSLFTALASVYLPEIAQQLATATSLLHAAVDMLSSPAETQAREKARWGLENLQRGYFEEAADDLHASVELYAYDPVVHLAHGLALSSQSRRGDAAGAWLLSVRYSKGRTPDVAIASALLANNALRGEGDPRSGRAVLEDALAQAPGAADLWLALAGHTRENQTLIEALCRDVDLYVAAAEAGLGPERAAHILSQRWMAGAAEARERLLSLASVLHVSGVVPVRSVPAAPDPSGSQPALLLMLRNHRTELADTAAEYVRQAAEGPRMEPLSLGSDRPVVSTYDGGLTMTACFGWIPAAVIAVAGAAPLGRGSYLSGLIAIFFGVWGVLVLVSSYKAVRHAAMRKRQGAARERWDVQEADATDRAQATLEQRRQRLSQARPIVASAEHDAEALRPSPSTRPFRLADAP